jgi:hypothetical protein
MVRPDNSRVPKKVMGGCFRGMTVGIHRGRWEDAVICYRYRTGRQQQGMEHVGGGHRRRRKGDSMTMTKIPGVISVGTSVLYW